MPAIAHALHAAHALQDSCTMACYVSQHHAYSQPSLQMLLCTCSSPPPLFCPSSARPCLGKTAANLASAWLEHEMPPIHMQAVPSWFVRVEGARERLLAATAKTTWVPSFVRDKRFGNWLENAHDWAVSRCAFTWRVLCCHCLYTASVYMHDANMM